MHQKTHFVKIFYVKRTALQNRSNHNPIWSQSKLFVPLPTLECAGSSRWHTNQALHCRHISYVMALQKGAVQVVGKFANMVGFKNSASEKKTPYFTREYVGTVSNPRTSRQARQRAKAKPAQMFYQAAEPILNHAFIPLGRASKNRNKFLSKAMALDAIPDIPKGESFLPALPYQISQGALGLDALVEGTAGSNSNQQWVDFNLISKEEVIWPEDGGPTVATLADALIGQNLGLSAGMELTFIAVIASKSNIKQRLLQHFSVVLDPNDTITRAGDIMGNLQISLAFQPTFTRLSINDADLYVLLSAGFIISAKSSSSWRYTNSFMVLTAAAGEGRAFTEAEVLQSYMDSGSSRESDKILQQADNISGGGEVTLVSTENVSFTTSVSGTLEYNTAAVAVFNNGARKVIISENDGFSNVLTHKVSTGNYHVITATNESTMAVVPVTLANSSLNGMQTVGLATVIAAGL